MVIVSACLLGVECRYDGKSKPNDELTARLAGDGIVPVCPEQLGGLTTPRPPAQIVGGDGEDVLDGKAKVVNRDGVDVTENYIRGAEQVLKLAQKLGITRAYLKSNSPACGFGMIRRGEDLVEGKGVCAALLHRNGIEVICV
ncbi:MAG: DUF523 domain-containing protein [Planctomycetes bacterium]|nr:DUF523 domain-containing protein [Planctomycetota bacterium]